MTTTNEVQTLQIALDKADPNDLADALRKVKLGTVLTPTKLDLSGTKKMATASATHDITDADHGKNQPILSIVSLRVTDVGTGATGVRRIIDDVAGGSATASVAKLSADGTTLTFEGTVKGFILQYIPRSFTPMTDEFAPRP